MTAEPDVPNFGNRAVREALETLREAGVTPEQYAHVHVDEVWELDQTCYPDMRSAFEAAKAKAATTGSAEVWRYFTWDDGRSDGGWESWIVTPDTTFTQYGYPSTREDRP